MATLKFSNGIRQIGVLVVAPIDRFSKACSRETLCSTGGVKEDGRYGSRHRRDRRDSNIYLLLASDEHNLDLPSASSSGAFLDVM